MASQKDSYLQILMTFQQDSHLQIPMIQHTSRSKFLSTYYPIKDTTNKKEDQEETCLAEDFTPLVIRRPRRKDLHSYISKHRFSVLLFSLVRALYIINS